MIETRTANESDCFLEIARCIYDTDPFIYPTAFGADRENAALAISELMKIPGSLLYYKNIFVAVTEGRICGIVLYNAHGARWNTEEYFRRIKDHVDDRQGFTYAASRYFEEEAKKPLDNHIELIAVCVSPAFRRRGIAGRLLASFIAANAGKTLELDVLSGNKTAVDLYTRCGFQITAQQKGFSPEHTPPPDCYHMILHS